LQIRAKKFLRTVIAIILIGILSYALGWSQLLSVRSITVSGTSHVDLVQSQLTAGGSKLVIRKPLARINPRTEEKLIEDLEWVSTANVSREWLSGRVLVKVSDRVPVAVFTGSPGSAPRYLAKDGVEFSSPDTFENLARISFSNNLENNLGNKSLSQRRQIATFVANLPPELVLAMSGLQITRTGEILMESNLRKPPMVINWGSGNSSFDVSTKSKVLLGLLGLPENKKISEVDLRISQSPIVK